MNTLTKLACIPVALAVVGAYLNSPELLAEYQPHGRAWVGYLGALSVSVALFICVEAFLRHPTWVTGAAVVGFGLAEVSTQILHAAMVRGDVVILTAGLRWIMGYLSPSVVVVVGVTMGFITHYGFGVTPSSGSEVDQLRGSLIELIELVKLQAVGTGASAAAAEIDPGPAAVGTDWYERETKGANLMEGKHSIVKVRLEGTQPNIAIVADQLQRDFWVLDRSRAYPNRNSKDIYRVYMVIYPRLPDMPEVLEALTGSASAPAQVPDGDPEAVKGDAAVLFPLMARGGG